MKRGSILIIWMVVMAVFSLPVTSFAESMAPVQPTGSEPVEQLGGIEPAQQQQNAQVVQPTSTPAALSQQNNPAAQLPKETVTAGKVAQGQRKVRTVVFPNQDRYWMERMEFAVTSKMPYIQKIVVPGRNGTIRYVAQKADANKKLTREWKTGPLGTVLPATTVFIDTDQTHMLISYPERYISRANHTLEYRANQYPIAVKQTAAGYELTVKFPQEKGSIGEVWTLSSAKPLVDWSKPNLPAIWLLLDLHDQQKWSWDGFYVKTPATYEPHGPNLYWRIPINYVAKSFVMTGGSQAADDLGWVMLSVILTNQNQQGYWETQPGSSWLRGLYGVQPGFYDTRFNTDMAIVLLRGYHKYKDVRFWNAANRYAQFFLEHVEKNHFVLQGPKEGWLVSDYAHLAKPFKPTHSSLNHQLQETKFLLEMFTETKLPVYEEQAQKLLQGVKNSTASWIKENLDLHYAYLPSGQMGMADYPFLTYDDLWQTQQMLIVLYGQMDSDLATLMESKKAFMDLTNITGYIQRPLPEPKPVAVKMETSEAGGNQ
ncbi:UNVERIFIED_CONTAM: hypothetical protein ABID98_000753 [Brevibacillus sp. OAP136]